MDLVLSGKIKVINQEQVFDSGFKKRSFVVTTAEQYPQDVQFDFMKDKCALLDKYKVGQDVDVGFNVRGNEYNGKYYVNLNAWKINLVVGASVPPAPVAASDTDDDLPF